ncbi:SDR family NAD(P)-dependent oxidoreductase [Geodermatophilus amargosae]|uniref:SDR family NAD(P)-dependent oxidoreductase n=1 Tax=Geodermatophilus amargosae TaxID=1296565 RepID=UPI0034DF7532
MGPHQHSGPVLITGASSGIGEDAALYLNELGHTVFAGVRRAEDGERVRSKAARPGAFHAVLLDVTDDAQVARAHEEVTRLLGPGQGLTALVSNAGIAALSGDVSCEGCPIETQQRVMDVNFFGAVRVVQAFLPLVRAARGTVVVNSALMAHTRLPFNGGYAASKCALEGWVDSLRREVAPLGVRVALIEAAGIHSDLEAKQDPSGIPADTPYRAQQPLIAMSAAMMRRRAGDPRLSPRRVSELMAAAIVDRRPRPRRIVGGGARPIWLLGCLPDRAQDAVFRAGLWTLARRSPLPTPGDAGSTIG